MPEWYRADAAIITADVPQWAVELLTQFKSGTPADVHAYMAARGWDLSSAVTYADLARAYASGLQWTTYMGVPEEHLAHMEEVIAHEQFLVAHNR